GVDRLSTLGRHIENTTSQKRGDGDRGTAGWHRDGDTGILLVVGVTGYGPAIRCSDRNIGSYERRQIPDIVLLSRLGQRTVHGTVDNLRPVSDIADYTAVIIRIIADTGLILVVTEKARSRSVIEGRGRDLEIGTRLLATNGVLEVGVIRNEPR